jgi:hypothetical protein
MYKYEIMPDLAPKLKFHHFCSSLCGEMQNTDDRIFIDKRQYIIQMKLTGCNLIRVLCIVSFQKGLQFLTQRRLV